MKSYSSIEARHFLLDIEALCRFERGSATDGERQAAEFLLGRLRRMGVSAELEGFKTYPHYYYVYILHALLLLAGVAINHWLPLAGLAIATLAAFSYWGDMTTKFHLLRRLFPQYPSQNVVGKLPAPAAPRRRIILSAHYDAAHSGFIFNPDFARRITSMNRHAQDSGPPIMNTFFFLMFFLIATLVPPVFGWQWAWLLWIQLPVCAVFTLGLVALIDIARRPVVPGANDNASAVSVVLALAEKLTREPLANSEVWVLLPGCEEGIMLGMKAFMETHRRELDRTNTYFFNLDSVGNGQVHYSTGEGFLNVVPYDEEMVAIAAKLATHEPFLDIRPNIIRLGTDAQAPNVRGYKAFNLICLDEFGHPTNYHWPSDRPENIEPESVEKTYQFSLAILQALDAK